MPKAPRVAAGGMVENVMRSMAAREQEKNETASVEHQSESGFSPVAPVVMEMPQSPVTEAAIPSKEIGIQTKLTVGAPGDPYEQEADRVAAQVMSMPAPPKSSPQVQGLRRDDNPVLMWKRSSSIRPVVQMRTSEHVQMWQLRRRAGGGNEASGDLESRLNASQGGGNALAPEVRAFMEPRFGADFSSVRVHTDGAAVLMNRELGAQAFAHGSDVYFGEGKSPGNNELTAHELTHVVQQTGAVARKQEPKPFQSERSQSKVPSYLEPIFSAQQGDLSLYRKGLQDFRQANSNETLERYQSNLKEPNQRVEITQTSPLQEARLMMRGNNPPAGKPSKQVSSKAMARIGKAEDAIKHTKSVFSYGAGNQTEALKATNFNSYFRMKAMRDSDCWQLTDSVKPIAAANQEALTAAKADLLHGGNCGEHAQVAFDYLRVQNVGETISLSDVNGLDHAFVLMGVQTDSDADIVVADPWPTRATATTWEDHFAYTSDRTQINLRHSMAADGQNVKAVIAAGLTLTDKGKKMAVMKLSDDQTDEQIKKGNHFWTHPDAAASGHDYDYHP